MLRRIVQFSSLVAVVGGLGALGAGCLDRPVVTAAPQTKTNFSTVVAQNSVDQLDILFDIDNSASMGDKQALLELAIPDLIARLTSPNCLDANNNPLAGVTATVLNGVTSCAMGSPEFNAVLDMHLGIVSSSLGTRGGDLCYPTQTTNGNVAFMDGNPSISSHTDDQGHLLGRSSLSALGGGLPPANAEQETAADPLVGTQNFIDWFPPPAAGSTDQSPTTGIGTPVLAPGVGEPVTDPTALEVDFANLVAGVHAFGCGIESQLESWYRFLVQPDPYLSIAPLTSASPAPGSWVGYDPVIIQQRHDFLRPNSLVAIIVLTDENDSEIDTRSFGGLAAKWMINGGLTTNPDGSQTGPFNPPRGTQICLTNPASPTCTSCAYPGITDPNCTLGPYTSPVDWGNDANLRHVHMKQKYGLDRLQYPIERYYLGLTSPTVPDRTTEYPTGASFYQGGTAQPNSTGTTTPGDPAQLNCTNPLFAPPLADGSTSLPNGSDMSPATLCNTAHPAVLGKSRGAGLVFFAHIGGVPHQLLQAQPGELDPVTMLPLCPATTAAADCPQKDTLATSDWTAILGNGAAQATATSGPSYDYSMIDPHMVESFITRDATIVPTGTAPLVASAALPTGGGADPINGREWITDTSTSTVVNGATVIAPVHQNLPVDREYACIFPLVDPTTGDPTPRDCSNPADFVNQEACDCSTQALSPAAPSQIPAVCGQCPGTAPNNCAMGGTDYNLQFYAKAYPTIREIELVHLMGGQGILSSLCPIHPSYAGGMTSDPVFGYRPAVTSIINRLKTALTGSCLPERLTPVAGSCPNDQNMTDECVQCLVLVNLSPMDPNQSCDQPAVGLTEPSAQVAANFALQQGDGGLTGKLCVVNQIPYQPLTATSSNTCKNSATPGWCYVTGPNAGSGCAATPQAIQFSANTPPNGSVVSLQCLEQSAVPDGG